MKATEELYKIVNIFEGYKNIWYTRSTHIYGTDQLTQTGNSTPKVTNLLAMIHALNH